MTNEVGAPAMKSIFILMAGVGIESPKQRWDKLCTTFMRGGGIIRTGYLLVGILLLITAVLPARAEVSDDQIFDYLVLMFQGRLPNHYIDTGSRWEDARKGGYLLQFSVGIFGDQEEEDFLISSMFMNEDIGWWKVFSGEEKIDPTRLPGTKFMVFREEDTTRLLYGAHRKLDYAFVVEQAITKNGNEHEWKSVHPRELAGLWEQWERTGEVIRPKIKVILLADFLRGSREWKAVDLLDGNTVTYSRNPISEVTHIVLKSDKERLSKMDFTPDVAFELLLSILRKIKPYAVVDSAYKASVINTKEVATIPPHLHPKGEEPALSKRRKLWLWLVGTWLVGAIMLVLVGGLLLKRRLRNRYSMKKRQKVIFILLLAIMVLGGKLLYVRTLKDLRVKVGQGEFPVLIEDGDYENLDKARLIWTVNNFFENSYDFEIVPYYNSRKYYVDGREVEANFFIIKKAVWYGPYIGSSPGAIVEVDGV